MMKKGIFKQLRDFFNLIRPYRGLFWLNTLLNGIAILLLNFVSAQAFKTIIDQIKKEIAIKALLIQIFVYLGLIIIAVCLFVLTFYLFLKLAARIDTHLRHLFYSKVLYLPLKTREDLHSGELQSRFNNDIRTVSRSVKLDTYYLSGLLINGIGSSVLIFFFDKRLMLCVLAVGVIGFLVNTLFIQPLRRRAGEIQKQAGDVNRIYNENIRGYETIKLFNLQITVQKRFTDEINRLKKHEYKILKVELVQGGINHLLSYINRFAVLGLSIYFFLNQSISVGTVIAVMHLAGAVTEMFVFTGRALGNFQRSFAIT